MRAHQSLTEKKMMNTKTKIICKCIFILLLESFLLLKINGEKTISELLKMTTSDMIREQGYQAEEHTVITEDGYLLKTHRIPGKSKAPAVLLQHGLLSNSFDFVVTGKNKSLAFILADHGYDVWLGNSRGNTYSRRHVKLHPSNPSFWNFSFHEMGVYDLPAVITYITNLKNDSIFYIGHSMGTTISYVMAIERPDIAAKVKVILSLAPSAFLTHSRTPFRILPPYATEDLLNKLQIYEYLPQSFFTRTILKYYCSSGSVDNICSQLILFVSGGNYGQFNYSLAPMILSHSPAGSSTKVAIHYVQIAVAEKFQRYDYRPRGNRIMYNCSQPPEYNISRMNVPVGLFWSENDRVIDPKDVQALYNLIPKKVLSYKVPDPQFTHIDFIWAMHAPTVLYSKVLAVMEDFK